MGDPLGKQQIISHTDTPEPPESLESAKSQEQTEFIDNLYSPEPYEWMDGLRTN